MHSQNFSSKSLESGERQDVYHYIYPDDVLKYGMHKAAILANHHVYANVEKEKLHEHFSYIPRDEFYIILQELVTAGALQETTR